MGYSIEAHRHQETLKRLAALIASELPPDRTEALSVLVMARRIVIELKYPEPSPGGKDGEGVPIQLFSCANR